MLARLLRRPDSHRKTSHDPSRARHHRIHGPHLRHPDFHDEDGEQQCQQQETGACEATGGHLGERDWKSSACWEVERNHYWAETDRVMCCSTIMSFGHGIWVGGQVSR